MKYRPLGHSGTDVSVIGLGTWALGDTFWGPLEENSAADAVRAALDAGITLIDTAPAYGRGLAEELVGEAIRGRRDEVFLATKCGLRFEGGGIRKDLSRESIRWEVEQSLSRLRVDRIDLYQCHWPDGRTPEEEVARTMTELKEEGKIRAVGVSNFNVKHMERFMRGGGLDSLQPPFSLLDREAERETLPWCTGHGVGVLTYGSLGGGLLGGRYTASRRPSDKRARFYRFFKEPRYSAALALVEVLNAMAREHDAATAQIAIAWTLSRPGVTCALVGARGAEQVGVNAGSADLVLEEQELRAIDAAYDRYTSSVGETTTEGA